MNKRTRFTALLDQGLCRSDAAQRVKVRSRTTAKRWHDQHLSTQPPEPPTTPSPTSDEMEPFWEYCRRHGRSQPIHSAQSWKAAGSPKPIPDPPSPPPPFVAPQIVDYSRVQADFGPSEPTLREAHLHRAAIAAEAATGDPFGRHMTDEDRMRAAYAWQEWKEDRQAEVWRAGRERALREQAERDRQTDLLSTPIVRLRGRR